ncbi:hypothetical protein [Thermogemmatispora carboxidivorans]|uniref:hypothetical protein n=1 Tax=Thermogemmatispora carboxidivorans TaxID=1382306 RepID=UPI00069B41FB|nr:hypothetical protein [Thermogemmatispora carboxidivorans]
MKQAFTGRLAAGLSLIIVAIVLPLVLWFAAGGRALIVGSTGSLLALIFGILLLVGVFPPRSRS